MKVLMISLVSLLMTPAFAVTWSYQVNVNNEPGSFKNIDASKKSFAAGAYDCEVTPVSVNNKTEYRSLVCAVGSGTVSTGGFCTQKGANVASVQYAILNLNGPKNMVNIVVACKF